MAESHAAFAEINYNAFGKKRLPNGEFPQHIDLREKYLAYTRSFRSPSASKADRRQAYLASILENRIGEEQTQLFRQSATDPRLVNITPNEDLALVRRRLVPLPPGRVPVVNRIGVPPN